jgi:S-sulfo-L-cysteine synthase (3-phospho-L-serine-dependent)
MDAIVGNKMGAPNTFMNPMNRNFLDVLEQPVIIQLTPNLFAIVFSLIKLVAARYIIRQGFKQGAIPEHGHIFESTSGTMGLGLAYACSEHRLSLTLVSDPVLDDTLRYRLETLGVRIVIVDTPLENGGMQGARLKKLEELIAETPGAYWTRQYDNPVAVDAYSRVGPTISKAIKKLDILVGSIATGSSATGLTRALRRNEHPCRLIAVDTHCSVLFGQPDGKRILRGLGNSIIPRNLDYSLVDECHWVSAGEAFQMTNHLFRSYLLDVGPTSGATYMVAKWKAAKQPDKNVAFLCADTGERYRQTIYNPQWLRSNHFLDNQLPSQPRLVEHPKDAGKSWTCMEWAGRSIESIRSTPGFSS